MGAFCVVGCAVERPDATLFILDIPDRVGIGYNMLTDYDDRGGLLTGVEPTLVDINSIWDLDKWMCLDPDSAMNLKAYIRKLRAR